MKSVVINPLKWSMACLVMVVVSASLGCERHAPPSPPLMDSVKKQKKQVDQSAIQTPEVFIENIRDNEKQALAVQDGLFKQVCRHLHGQTKTELPLTPTFRGRWISDGQPSHQSSMTNPLKLGPFKDATAFRDALTQTAARWRDLARCHLKVSGFRRTGQTRAWVRLDMHLAGHMAGTMRFDWYGHPTAVVESVESSWRLASFDLGQTHWVHQPQSLFVDVTQSVGATFQYADKTRSALTDQTDSRQLETIGGLAVLDWNTDGYDDFIAWNQRRTMQVFVNDTVGGFTPVSTQLPVAHIGVFMLWLDLDSDGRLDVVSSQAIDCKQGKAQFPVYTKTGDGLVRNKGSLAFKTPCGALDQLKFQHITAADVDADGDLDLFFSGFSNRYSKKASHNHLRSTGGELNRLFINQGQLTFTEESKQRGFNEVAFTYASQFFDYDDDGDSDLYVTNDYGHNHLYINDGRGHFALTQSTLSENGQSMGVSEADIDGDGQLDLYVSNMYSKAGHRIVPLAKDQLSQTTYDELQRIATGNTAYLRRGPSQYEEAAGPLAIAKAGWAWGHTLFDADLDGDLDLYVLNGHTTHSRARAPDY